MAVGVVVVARAAGSPVSVACEGRRLGKWQR